jgi:hypothetical protein
VLENVQVFATKWFARFARREGIPDRSLLEAIERAERGSVDADLGGGLIKQRIARPGKRRSGGYRTVIAYRRAGRAVFLFGFAKSALENIAADDLATARETASLWLDSDPTRIRQAIADGALVEVPNDSKKA